MERRQLLKGIAAIPLLNVFPRISSNDNHNHVNCWLFAHQDDETLAAGASMRRFADEQNLVVIMTDGAQTAAARRIGLDENETTFARNKECRAALAMNDIYDVRFVGVGDGELETTDVLDTINNIVGEFGNVSFFGHSPWDYYSGRHGGHPDHKAIGDALVASYRSGIINSPVLFRIGHLFGDSQSSGTPREMTKEEQAYKNAMLDEYAVYKPEVQRYAIGNTSVPDVIRRARTHPEIIDAVFDRDMYYLI